MAEVQERHRLKASELLSKNEALCDRLAQALAEAEEVGALPVTLDAPPAVDVDEPSVGDGATEAKPRKARAK